jgi:hypothetical protein
MVKKFALIALAALPLGLANAGTEMVIDNSAQTPAYTYAPPPPPVYYIPPPPPTVVVYPRIAYYRPVRAFGYHRWYPRHGYRGEHYWR